MMSKAPERLTPDELRKLISLHDNSRAALYSENDPKEIKRLRLLIEQLEIEIRRTDSHLD